ncbi:YceI family protein [uncultured Corynebacterium sp.]|uniref:YceI family protein n=1 Tax=uncultured Corynebacterium sp. TaxID=159447 RepID=UPI0025FC6E2A|nr:YceI family protein [uncultured Corynebacterium sp.]
MKKVLGNRKLVIGVFGVGIILLTLVALVPLALSLISGGGVTTEDVDSNHAKAAEGELDGQWDVVKGNPRNFTSVGFTFNEVLPAEKRATSGSTTKVTGTGTVEGGMLNQASISVDMTTLTTDKEVRDHNMKSKLFETQKYPHATFELTKPVDLSALPTDGTMGTVELTGTLTIKDKAQTITQSFNALRDGTGIVIGGKLPINREDYDVITPDFIAAQIAEEGTIDLRLSFEHQ